MSGGIHDVHCGRKCWSASEQADRFFSWINVLIFVCESLIVE